MDYDNGKYLLEVDEKGRAVCIVLVVRAGPSIGFSRFWWHCDFSCGHGAVISAKAGAVLPEVVECRICTGLRSAEMTRYGDRDPPKKRN